MGKTLYIDCFSGISGDMMVGALLDAGLDMDYLKDELGKLGLTGYKINKTGVMAGAISATKFDVEIKGKQRSRDYSDIKKLIDSVKKITHTYMQKKHKTDL